MNLKSNCIEDCFDNNLFLSAFFVHKAASPYARQMEKCTTVGGRCVQPQLFGNITFVCPLQYSTMISINNTQNTTKNTFCFLSFFDKFERFFDLSCSIWIRTTTNEFCSIIFNFELDFRTELNRTPGRVRFGLVQKPNNSQRYYLIFYFRVHPCIFIGYIRKTQ